MKKAPLLQLMAREFYGFAATPVALVLTVLYVAVSASFTFYFGGFFERNQADMEPFLQFQPWIMMVLIAAISMRSFAEERRSGSLEILLTLPVSLFQIVLSKFLMVWLLSGVLLFLTLPVVFTVAYLGDPDIGLIVSSYFGLWLLCGVFAALCNFASSLTQNQVIAFVLGFVLCFVLFLSNSPLVLSVFPADSAVASLLVDMLSRISIASLCGNFMRGVADLHSIAGLSLWAFLFMYAAYFTLQSRQRN